MRRSQASGTELIDSDAKALAFFADAGGNSVLQLFSDDGRTAVALNRTQSLPLLQRVREGMWQGQFKVSNLDADVERLDNVLTLFGFGTRL
jgi:hypothetical protein